MNLLLADTQRILSRSTPIFAILIYTAHFPVIGFFD